MEKGMRYTNHLQVSCNDATVGIENKDRPRSEMVDLAQDSRHLSCTAAEYLQQGFKDTYAHMKKGDRLYVDSAICIVDRYPSSYTPTSTLSTVLPVKATGLPSTQNVGLS